MGFTAWTQELIAVHSTEKSDLSEKKGGGGGDLNHSVSPCVLDCQAGIF